MARKPSKETNAAARSERAQTRRSIMKRIAAEYGPDGQLKDPLRKPAVDMAKAILRDIRVRVARAQLWPGGVGKK